MSATFRLPAKARTPLPLRPRRNQAQMLARIDALAQLIDLLDLVEADCDLEAEEDCCVAGDDNPTVTPQLMGYSGDGGSGDEDGEPDNEDCCLAGDDRGTFHRSCRA